MTTKVNYEDIRKELDKIPVKSLTPRPRDPNCHLCKEIGDVVSRCVWGRGEKPSDIMVIGMNPGREEDIRGMPFVGPSGKILNDILKNVKARVYITNIVKCFYRRSFTNSMIRYCLPYLLQEIQEVKPKVIVTLGTEVSHALVGKKNLKDIQFLPQEPRIDMIRNIPVLATYHPAAALRRRKKKEELYGESLKGFVTNHITNTFKLAEKLASKKEQKSHLPTEYEVATTIEQLEEFLKDVELLSIDIETTSLSEFEGEIKCIGMCKREGFSLVIPWKKNIWKDNFEKVKEILRGILRNPRITLIGHNVKFDLRWMLQVLGMETDDIKCDIEDTIIMHHLLAEDQRHGLKDLAWKVEGFGGYDRDIKKSGGPQKAEGHVLYQYNACDTDLTLRLYFRFKEKLAKEGMYYRPYRELLIPVTKTLLDMERKGAPADKHFLLYAHNFLHNKFNEILDEINEDPYVRDKFPKRRFNPFSHRDMEILCSDYLEKAPKTDKGNPSFSKEFLEKFSDEYPLFGKILRLKKVQTILSHIAKQYLPAIHNGRIHPTFTLFIARSGRTSSQSPNLQNLSSQPVEGIKIRNMIYAPKGWVLLSADFSLHELRVAAAISKDPVLTKVLNEGIDVHSLTASLIFNIPYDKFTSELDENEKYKEMRKVAKTINFGVLYGMSAEGLARRLKIPVKEAEQYIEKFFDQYPQLSKWIEDIKKKANMLKRVTTPFSRVRILQWEQSIERKAINTPIQSAASDLLLLGLTRVHHHLKQNGFQTHPIIEVHDEILFLAKKDEVDDVLPIIKQILENPEGETWLGDVKLKVDFKIGKRWGEMEEI